MNRYLQAVCMAGVLLAALLPVSAFAQTKSTSAFNPSQGAAQTTAATPPGQSKIFPPANCSPSQPLISWNNTGDTYCTAIPTCNAGDFLTSAVDANGNNTFKCATPVTTSQTASSGTSSGSSGASSGAGASSGGGGCTTQSGDCVAVVDGQNVPGFWVCTNGYPGPCVPN